MRDFWILFAGIGIGSIATGVSQNISNPMWSFILTACVSFVLTFSVLYFLNRKKRQKQRNILYRK